MVIATIVDRCDVAIGHRCGELLNSSSKNHKTLHLIKNPFSDGDRPGMRRDDRGDRREGGAPDRRDFGGRGGDRRDDRRDDRGPRREGGGERGGDVWRRAPQEDRRGGAAGGESGGNWRNARQAEPAKPREERRGGEERPKEGGLIVKSCLVGGDV